MSEKNLEQILTRLDKKLNPPLWKKILDYIGRYFFTIGFFIIGLVMMFAALGVYWTVRDSVDSLTSQGEEIILNVQERIGNLENLSSEKIQEVIDIEIRKVVDNAMETARSAIATELESVKAELRDQVRQALSESLGNINLFDTQN